VVLVPPNNTRRNTKTTEEPLRKVKSGLSAVASIHDKKHEIYLKKNRLCNNNEIAKTAC
jgi:hypothetical protein